MGKVNIPENKGRIENWSKYVKRRGEDKLDRPKISEKIENLVRDYKPDLSNIFILDMFSNGVSKNHIYETAKIIFNEDKDIIADKVEAQLESLGLAEMTIKLDSNLQVGDKIRATIASECLSEIKERVKGMVNDSPDKIREGVYLLSYYVTDKLDRDRTHITPSGFERTWRIFSDDKDLEAQDLVNTGMLYKKYYRYDTGSYWYYVVPRHSLVLLGELAEGKSNLKIPCSAPQESEIQDLVEQEKVKEFIKWMGGTTKYVDVSREEEQIKEEMKEDKISLTFDEFEKVRDRLVKEDVLIFDYSPQRNSTGKMGTKEATWKYKLTQLVIDSVPILKWRPSEFY